MATIKIHRGILMEKNEVREALTLSNHDEKMFGILHRPLVQSKAPLVIFCSGFAGNKCGKYRLYVRLAQELAKMGIAVLRFDYRGAGDSEGDFQNITIESKVEDTLKWLDFLSNDTSIDRNRIGLLGRSFGGIISILTAKKYKNIKSLSLWAPVFNSTHWQSLWQSMKANQLNVSQKSEIKSLPFDIPNATFVQEFFKLNLASELETLKNIPLLHIQALMDKIVPPDHAAAYREARNGVAVETMFAELPHSDHDFSDSNDQKEAIKLTAEWFKRTL